MLRLGQAVPGTNFDVAEAELLAEQMWNLFGLKSPDYNGPRPIGDDVTVDGFEMTLNIDNPDQP